MILDCGDGYFLRRATAADHSAIAMICLKTGNAGEDATATEDDPDLLGLIYAIPYQVLEPEFAHVIDGPDGVCGYLFGALDTLAFNARLAEAWYPDLRKRAADPGSDRSRWRGSDWARRLVHHADFSVSPALAAYPSHGHIDLLPNARGRGIGSKAMVSLEERLASARSRGLHLQVHPKNEKALRFYAALGFTVLRDRSLPDDFIYVGKRFDERLASR